MVVVVDPERKRTLAQFALRINGSNAPLALDADVISVVVDERLHSPTMVEIHLLLQPENPRWIDDGTVAEGKEIEVLAGYLSEEASLCIAKVTSIEVDFTESQPPRAIIRGYDLSFALHRDVKSRSFLEQTDSDIAKAVASEAPGLTAEIEATTEINPYVLQHAQTNYDFLLDRARRIGYELRVTGRKLHFRKPVAQGKPVELQWGSTLKQFSPRLSLAEQVDEVEVRSWDTINKDIMVSTAQTATSAPSVGEPRTASAIAKEAWGPAKRVISDAPFASVNEGTTIAQAVLDDLTSSFIQATGECHGDPRMRVGTKVTIKGVGKRFAGDYYVTAARHSITKRDGHSVEFSASTRNPDTIATLLYQIDSKPLAPHVMAGIVTNNDDPQQLGRIKVKLPALFAEDESYWARLVSPSAGSERGFLTIPEVNDEVVVAFEHGDPTRPYILGSVWNSVDPPPEGTAPILDGGSVNQRLWRSRSGHVFIFDDADGQESIQIIDKSGKNHIIITSSDNKLDVQLEGDIAVTSRSGKISITAEKDVSIESSSGKVSVKGVTTEFEARQSGTIKAGTSLGVETGTSLTAKAGTSAELNGSVSAKLQGGMVDVQGQSVTNVKGGVVNIN